MSVIAHQTEKNWISANEKSRQRECHKHRLRAQQSNMQPDLRKHICEHIIRVLQHQKDVNQKQHICVKHDFVKRLSKPGMGNLWPAGMFYSTRGQNFNSTVRERRLIRRAPWLESTGILNTKFKQRGLLASSVHAVRNNIIYPSPILRG
ncbi:hypothetical protein TNCV_1530501 [Trichonephila clavipes]|uniref:Uncharacterized protein n=1 Tax=Trichonephila clavipes TaxID=2585209 RepID=A0A8X6R821_TRICX|nr:hypothetical protein TNCV_1530501 [Trichonephila clavipes]